MRPRIAIIGLGAYFQKLLPGIRRFFEIALLCDARPLVGLPAELSLSPPERAVFREVDPQLESLRVPSSVDCFMILSPPFFHVPQAERLAPLGKPVLVEKPNAANPSELAELEAVIRRNPRIYCSDFYPDVRATALMRWYQRAAPTALGPEFLEIAGDLALWTSGPASLGRLESIEGQLLEGDATRTFSGRQWLWEPMQGGVISDLMYHYFTLSRYLLDASPQIEKAASRVPDNEDALGRAETFASAEGFIEKVPFRFKVSNHADSTLRRYEMCFESGSASMYFRNPNVLELTSGIQRCSIVLQGSYYEHVPRCFLSYVTSGCPQPHGFLPAVEAVRAVDQAKSVGPLV